MNFESWSCFPVGSVFQLEICTYSLSTLREYVQLWAQWYSDFFFTVRKYSNFQLKLEWNQERLESVSTFYKFFLCLNFSMKHLSRSEVSEPVEVGMH